MKEREQEKSTRDRIFEAAVKLFAQKGYHGTSMRDLARAVGLKESSLYNHFPGKGTLLEAVLAYQLEGFQAASAVLEELEETGPSFTDPMELWIAGAAAFIEKLPPLTDTIGLILHNEMFLDEQCGRFVLHELFRVRKDLTEKLLRRMHAQGLIRSCDFPRTAAQYVHMLHGLEMENRLRQREGAGDEELQARLMEQIVHFIDGLRNKEN
jgi:AcrR family transcriptional regulator